MTTTTPRVCANQGHPGACDIGLECTIGGAPVTVRDLLERAVSWAAAWEPAPEDAEQVAADVAATRAILAGGRQNPEGVAASNRLLVEATEYAQTCGYAEDPTCDLVEQMLGSGVHAGLAVCWRRA